VPSKLADQPGDPQDDSTRSYGSDEVAETAGALTGDNSGREVAVDSEFG